MIEAASAICNGRFLNRTLFDSLTLLYLVALSQHHSTAPPSLKRYDKRYDVRILSEEEPNLEDSPTKEISDVCLYP
jgi:hypothetical protein